MYALSSHDDDFELPSPSPPFVPNEETPKLDGNDKIQFLSNAEEEVVSVRSKPLQRRETVIETEIGDDHPKICVRLPPIMQIVLKKKSTPITLITFFVFDFILFLQLSTNLVFGPRHVLLQSQISLFFSCFIFGLLFDTLGRK